MNDIEGAVTLIPNIHEKGGTVQTLAGDCDCVLCVGTLVFCLIVVKVYIDIQLLSIIIS